MLINTLLLQKKINYNQYTLIQEINNFQKILIQLPISVVIYDSSNENITYSNNEAKKIFNTYEETTICAILKEMGINYHIIIGTKEYTSHYKGNTFQLSFNELSLVGKEEFNIYTIIISNITSSEQCQRALTEKKYKYLYMTTISHELKTPLNAIKSMLLLLSSYICQEGKEYLEIAMNAYKIQKALINNSLVSL